MVGKPTDTVLKITCLPRWQREWINNNRALNYSGLVQEMLSIIIAEHDPEYYEKYKNLTKIRMMKRKENVLASVQQIELVKN